MTKPAHPIPAVGAFVMRGEKILLIRRARDPRKGDWSIPGGKVDWGETLEAATIREVIEETGLTVSVGQHLISTEMRYGPTGHDDPKPDYHYVLIDYICTPTDLAAQPIAGDGVSESGFYTETEALDMVAWGETREAITLAFALWNQRTSGS